MKRKSKVDVKVGFVTPKEFQVEKIYSGEYKPLTKKEIDKLNSLYERMCFNNSKFCLVSFGGKKVVVRPVFVHSYKGGDIVPLSGVESVWNGGNIDPKYLLTTKGFVLASENYGINIGHDGEDWVWVNNMPVMQDNGVPCGAPDGSYDGMDTVAYSECDVPFTNTQGDVQTFDVEYVDSQKK